MAQKKSSDSSPALTLRQKRTILSLASNSKMFARQIAEDACVKTHIKNVRRILQKYT